MRQAERMIEVYHGTALVCAGLALAFLILAAVMFFVFRIPRTVAFLSGRTARRSIRRMRREMEGKPETGGDPRKKKQIAAEGKGDATTVFLKERKSRNHVCGAVGILLGFWTLWGGELLGAEMQKTQMPEAEVQEMEAQEPEEIGPPENTKPEDHTPPEIEIIWRNEEGNLIEEFYLSSRELAGELVIREEYLDRENTIFHLKASGAAGQKLPCREAELVDGKSWRQLWEMLQEDTEGDSLEMEEAEGIYRMRLRLTAEAEYEFSAEIVDETGNRAESPEGSVQLGAFCLDRTPPEIRGGEGADGRPGGDITWSAEQQTFFKKRIHGLTFGYFCRPVMTVKIGAWDPVSGIASITYEWEGKIGEETDGAAALAHTADWENGLLEDAEGGKAYAVLELSESFQGVVRATARDRAGNEMGSWSETVGLLGESEAMHRKSSGLSVEILEGEGKKEGFYRGDVKLQVCMKDTFSGIRTVQLQAGDREELLCFEEEEELVTEESYLWLLKASEHSGNNLPLGAVLTDFAGHTTEPVSLPVIHMDTAAPQVSLAWSHEEAKNEIYYNQDRTARITVRERNFDPEDVQLELAGMEEPELAWSHEPGKDCSSSSDPRNPGHGDDCGWSTELVFDKDGTYEFGFSCRDAAGNEGSLGRKESFVIDKTPPLLAVKWNEAEARNGKYYDRERKASVVITEANFRPEDVRVARKDSEKAGGKPLPEAVEFRSFGDEWQAELVFSEDGTFQLLAEYTDLAGNAAVPYESEEFVVDRTPPEIRFFGVEDHSANRGAVAPGFRVRDVNCDTASCSQEWTGIGGRGQIPGCGKTEEQDGLLVRWKELEFLPENDDLYRIRAKAVDLAGNRTEEEFFFSVNRFGSVYVLEKETDALAGLKGAGYTSESPELVIEEYNVDFLKEKRVLCSRDGETAYLKEGRDYTVEQSGTADSWKRYRYRISGGNFKREGTYLVVLYSEDEASNSSSSTREEKRLEFVVDKTGPDIVIANVEEQGQYRGKSRRVHIDMQDISGLQKAKLYRNGSCAAVWEREELLEKQGLLTYTVPEENRWQTLQVRAWDGAGNESVTKKLHVYVTDSRMLQFWEDMRLYGAIGLFLLCGGAAGTGFVRRRKKTKA